MALLKNGNKNRLSQKTDNEEVNAASLLLWWLHFAIQTSFGPPCIRLLIITSRRLTNESDP